MLLSFFTLDSGLYNIYCNMKMFLTLQNIKHQMHLRLLKRTVKLEVTEFMCLAIECP